MLVKIENQPVASAPRAKLFDDETLPTILSQAQKAPIPINKSITDYYLFSTGNGKIYDKCCNFRHGRINRAQLNTLHTQKNQNKSK